MAFMNLIMSGGAGGNVGAGAGAGAGLPGAGGIPAQQPPGTMRVTQQEMEAIQRLQSLGFSQGAAA